MPPGRGRRHRIARLEVLLRQRATLETQVRSLGEQQQSESERLYLELIEVLDLLDTLASGLEASAEGLPPVVGRAGRAVRSASGKLLQSLTGRGVQVIPDPDGELDFAQHRVLESELHPDRPDQSVVKVLRKGYRLDDRILRPTEIITSRQS